MRALVVVLLLAGCGGPIAARDHGRALAADPAFSSSQFNTFSCATCHALEQPEPNRIYPGAPLADSVHRGSWWGGSAARYLDAVNHCAVYFMRDAPLSREDPKGRALYEYLLSISPDESAAPVPVTVVENITTVPKGDPRRGAEVWDAACKVCHGAAQTGDGRMSELVSIVPEDSVAFAASAGVPVSLVIVEKVRHGQFFGVGGNMPFFSTEALSDEDLGALLGYLDP